MSLNPPEIWLAGTIPVFFITVIVALIVSDRKMEDFWDYLLLTLLGFVAAAYWPVLLLLGILFLPVWVIVKVMRK